MEPSKYPKICITDPHTIYPILDGIIYQKTQASTMRDFEEGQKIELYFRNLYEKSCQSCLTSKTIRGTNCPYFKKEAYIVKKNNPLKDDSATKYLCSKYTNFLSFAKVTHSKKIESFGNIMADESLLQEYSKAEGFRSTDEYLTYYSKWFGINWLETSLNVFRWEIIKER